MTSPDPRDPRVEAAAEALYEHEMRDILQPDEGWDTLTFETTRDMWRESAAKVLAAADAVDPLRQQPQDSAESLCGDFPAPCNCDDPINHGGHRRSGPDSWEVFGFDR